MPRSRHTLTLIGFVLGVAAAVAIAGNSAAAQGDAAGRAAASRPTPRTADGHPDLSGMWYRRLFGPVTRRVGKSIVMVAPAAASGDGYHPGVPKYKPQFLAKVKELTDDQVNMDPAFKCGPPGLPRIGPPQRIVQTRGEVVILYDDLNGSFHTPDLKVTERLTRQGDTLKWEAVAEDPEVLAEPWKVTPRTLTLMANTEIEEAAFCEDRGAGDRVTGDYHGNIR